MNIKDSVNLNLKRVYSTEYSFANVQQQSAKINKSSVDPYFGACAPLA